jgi:predicted RNA-binding Zn-ribbon protein involved in translation (DUF1610 family)/Zn-finger nucleic acid-binding protein
MNWRCRQCGTVQPATAHYRGATCARCRGPLSPDEDLQVAFECPFCHEDVDASASRCAKCKRSFGVPRCAACGARITGDEEQCAQCAAIVPREPHQKLPLHHSCPVCRVPLEEKAMGRAVALACRTCSGAFIEHDVIEQWTADRGSDAPDDVGETRAVIADSTVRYRRCPRCAEWMNRINFGSTSGIILDSCRDDGIWFDGGELVAAIEFARSGKLDAGRKRVREEREKAAERERIERARSRGAIVKLSAHQRTGQMGASWAVALVQWFFGW